MDSDSTTTFTRIRNNNPPVANNNLPQRGQPLIRTVRRRLPSTVTGLSDSNNEAHTPTNDTSKPTLTSKLSSESSPPPPLRPLDSEQRTSTLNTNNNNDIDDYYRSGTPTPMDRPKARVNRIFSQIKVPPAGGHHGAASSSSVGKANSQDETEFDAFSYASRPSNKRNSRQNTADSQLDSKQQPVEQDELYYNQVADHNDNNQISNKSKSNKTVSYARRPSSSAHHTPTPPTRPASRQQPPQQQQQPLFIIKDNHVFDNYESSNYSIPKKRWLRAFDMVKAELPGVSVNFFYFICLESVCLR